ncbi:hypothetical protein BD289DRAFT_483772 [Coniella lustricola]|uniref:MARVEL domain-containing protein n=1 Tax=Coniella lustricola TaxID=2025994 RepID=A0A2T3A4A2_9PEZI|nr:hypothetical protein BD289DRAFT_483772 [Coniella lustricola]
MAQESGLDKMSRIFNWRYKLAIHIMEMVLIVAVLAMTAARLTMKGVQVRSRSNTIALSFSAKSIVFIGYQLLTDHVARLQRFKNLKAYAILNGADVVFWAAVVYLVAAGNSSVCEGTACSLAWVVVALSCVMSLLCLFCFLISYTAFRQMRREQAKENQISQEHPQAMAETRVVPSSSSSEYLSK